MGKKVLRLWLKSVVLHVAKDLLVENEKKTIDEIVFEAGFSNKVTFFKVFRKSAWMHAKRIPDQTLWRSAIISPFCWLSV